MKHLALLITLILGLSHFSSALGELINPESKATTKPPNPKDAPPAYQSYGYDYNKAYNAGEYPYDYSMDYQEYSKVGDRPEIRGKISNSAKTQILDSKVPPLPLKRKAKAKRTQNIQPQAPQAKTTTAPAKSKDSKRHEFRIKQISRNSENNKAEKTADMSDDVKSTERQANVTITRAPVSNESSQGARKSEEENNQNGKGGKGANGDKTTNLPSHATTESGSGDKQSTTAEESEAPTTLKTREEDEKDIEEGGILSQDDAGSRKGPALD